MIIGFGYQATNTQLALHSLNLARLNLVARLLEEKNSKIKASSIESVVNHLFANPTTHSKFMEKETGIHWQTCTKYLNYLSEIKILGLEKRGRYRFFYNNLALKALNKSLGK